MLSKKEVLYVASLSRIHLDEAQIEHFQKDLAKILGYVDKLKELDVTGVEPTSHVLRLENVYREDLTHSSLPQEEALKMAVEKHNGSFKVPRVIE